MRELLPQFSQSRFQISLDDGADECNCACRRLESRGAVFDSRWYFEPLRSVSLCIVRDDQDCQCRRKSLEGVVVDCRKVAGGRYETTVLFVNPADDDGTPSGEFSHVSG